MNKIQRDVLEYVIGGKMPMKNKIQDSIERIALDYLAITGAKDLKELKEKHEYYYGKFIEEKNRVNNKKIKVTIAEITSKTEELLEKNIIKIYCQNCNKELFRYSNKVYLVPEEIQFIRKNNIIKTKCTCEKVEEFQKVGNEINPILGDTNDK